MVEARKFFNVREGQKFSTSTEGGGDILKEEEEAGSKSWASYCLG